MNYRSCGVFLKGDMSFVGPRPARCSVSVTCWLYEQQRRAWNGAWPDWLGADRRKDELSIAQGAVGC